MKKLFFFSLLICFTLNISAQEMALSITGLENGDKVSRVLIQSATSGNGNAYVIVKKQHANSTTLKEAAMTKRVFPAANLLRKFPNGDIITTKLTNIWFSDYTESGSGAGMTESFTLHFEDELEMH